MSRNVHSGFSDGSTCDAVALGAGAFLYVGTGTGLHTYSHSSAALGDFIGSATGELVGVHCLLNITEDAMADGRVVRGDWVIMHTDSEVVWGYLTRATRPGMPYLVPLVALMRRRIHFLSLNGLNIDVRWVPRANNTAADRLARAALQSLLRETRLLRENTPFTIFLVDWRLSGSMQDALFQATRGMATTVFAVN